MADNSLYDEWSVGVSLANSVPEDNEFFQEIPMELNTPDKFEVSPDQIPPNPVEETPAVEPVKPDVPPPPPPEEDNTEVINLDNGGVVTIEKTSRGWKASLDSGEYGKPIENFYGNNKTQLIANLAKAKLEATKVIHKLKKEKLLGSEEIEQPSVTPTQAKPIPSTRILTADDVAEIKNAMTDNPAEAFEIWLRKRFGKDPDQFEAALNASEEARSIVEAQRVKSEVDDVNADFLDSNSDWADEYAAVPENIRKLVARMAKAHLNKRVNPHTPQATVDALIYELYSKGQWTVKNLEKAKDELVEIGELQKLPVTPVIPKQEPKPVAVTSGPSVPEKPRIAPTTGQPVVPVSFGVSAKSSVSTTPVEEKTLTDVDLQTMPLSELRKIAAEQLRTQQQGRQ